MTAVAPCSHGWPSPRSCVAAAPALLARARPSRPGRLHVVGTDGRSACGRWTLSTEDSLPPADVPESQRCTAIGCRVAWPRPGLDPRLPSRIAEKISAPDENGCWLWMGALGDHGYGMAWDGARMVGAHRLVYELLVGPIPDGLALDHVKARGCHTTACVNPAHTEPVTQGENNRRAMRDTCKHGHPWTDENTYLRPDKGTRQCRACGRERSVA